MTQNMMMQMHEKSHNHLPNVTWHNYLDIDIWSNVDESTHVIRIAFHNMSTNEITPCEQVMPDRSWSIYTINSCTNYKFTWTFLIEALWSAFKCLQVFSSWTILQRWWKTCYYQRDMILVYNMLEIWEKVGLEIHVLLKESIIAYMCNNTFKKCFHSLWAKIHNIMFLYRNLNNKLCFKFGLRSCSSWMGTWIVHMIFRERVTFF